MNESFLRSMLEVLSGLDAESYLTFDQVSTEIKTSYPQVDQDFMHWETLFRNLNARLKEQYVVQMTVVLNYLLGWNKGEDEKSNFLMFLGGHDGQCYSSQEISDRTGRPSLDVLLSINEVFIELNVELKNKTLC